MEEQVKNRVFGLLGKNISYSFSKQYFSNKFQKESIENSVYKNFDLSDISEIQNIFKHSDLKGLNVTIPYKESVIPFLDELDSVASLIGAVNTIQLSDGKKIGYNTDVIGFEDSLKPLLKTHHKRALILGTGGASKAIDYVLEKLNIEAIKVSRNPKKGEINYQDIHHELINNYSIIINCTPLGTFPEINLYPNIPYHFISEDHLLYDLIYNPAETQFLQLGKSKGATIKNGLEMLELQAEASWKIWNS